MGTIKLSCKSNILAVVLNYNSGNYLERCLTSIFNQKYKNYRVIVCDNNSSDDSTNIINGLLDKFDFEPIYNKVNSGFAGGMNDIFFNINKKENIYLTMNPDVCLAPDFLGNLAAVMKDDPLIGAAGAVLYSLGETDFLNGHLKTDLVDSTGLFYDLFLRPKDRRKLPIPTYIEEVPAVCGAVMALRSEAFHEIGGFDDTYFAYSEDLDICFRLNSMGWKIVTNPSSIAWHIRGGHDSVKGVVPSKISVLGMVNKNITPVKNFSWYKISLYFIPVVCYEFARSVYIAFKAPTKLIWIRNFIMRLPDALSKRKQIKLQVAANPKKGTE